MKDGLVDSMLEKLREIPLRKWAGYAAGFFLIAIFPITFAGGWIGYHFGNRRFEGSLVTGGLCCALSMGCAIATLRWSGRAGRAWGAMVLLVD